MNRGLAKQFAPGHGPAAAIADYDRAIELMQALCDAMGDDWPVPWRNELANAFMNRGNAKQSAPGHGPAAAIADYDRAIELMQALCDAMGDDWPVPWRNDLAAAMMNRGNAKRFAPGHGPAAAIADYDRAIALWGCAGTRPGTADTPNMARTSGICTATAHGSGGGWRDSRTMSDRDAHRFDFRRKSSRCAQ